MCLQKKLSVSVLLHDFPVAALSSNTRAEAKHLSTSSSLFKSWAYICWTEVNKNATNIQPLATAAHHNALTATLKGKAGEPH